MCGFGEQPLPELKWKFLHVLIENSLSSVQLKRVSHTLPPEQALTPSPLCAAGTLVLTKSGRDFATGPNDWRWFNKDVRSKVKGYSDKGYKIVILTNQGGIKAALIGAAMCHKFESFLAQA